MIEDISCYLKQTSPSVQYVNRFETVPPGEHPITSMPIAKGASICRACAKAKVSNGITANCDTKPTSTPTGRRH